MAANSTDLFVYDLMAAVRRDPAKAAAVDAALGRIDSITKAIANGKASRSDLIEAQAAVIPMCGFNFGLLIPMFFPRYPLDEPLSLLSRPFMFSMTSLAPDSVVTLKAGRQVGKCVDGATEVLTESHGSLSMGALFAMAH